jgi:ABC-type transport system involved in multi-copper enzyme maturation permease subunit
MSRFLSVLSGLDNPLIVKDGISRMRSWRAPLAITLYLGLLGAFGYAIFTISVLTSQYTRTVSSAQIGSSVFVSLAFFQLALISLFAPALAAGAISGERERQTFDVLLVSRVSAFGIVWGKLVASLAYLVLLILTALPLFAAVFLFGGIDFEQFVLAHVLTIATAVSIGAVSLFWSALFRRSLPATVTSYAAAFFMVVGTFVAGILLTYIYAFRSGVVGASAFEFHPLAYGNPLFALYVVLASPSGAPVRLGRLLQLLFMSGGEPSRWGPELEPWKLCVGSELALTAIAILGSVLLVRGRRAMPLGRPRKRALETAS